jgi:ketosteroid isomerase-like protein
MPRVTAEQAKEDLLEIMRGWTKACGGAVKDYAFLDHHLDDAFVYTDFHGVRRTKAEYLKFIDIILVYTQEMRTTDVRVLGDDLVIFSGVYRSTAEVIQGPMANTIDFCAVWQLRGDVWKCLVHHTVRVPDPT